MTGRANEPSGQVGMLGIEAPGMRLPSAFDLTMPELAALRPPNDPGYLYRRLFRVADWLNDAPPLGKEGAAFVAKHFDLRLPKIIEQFTSKDGSTKVLIRLRDGSTVEAVHMPRAVKNPRVTFCISSQVGCAMGCTFCHTGTMGLSRNLEPYEIVGQVLALMRALGPRDPGRVTIVFMGMGEPLHNVDAVLRSVEVLSQQEGLAISPQRITISTAGLVPGIDRLAQAKTRPCLAISINATTDEARSRTMPIARKYSLSDLTLALERFHLRPHEKVTFEYVLLRGENDLLEDAVRLANIVRPFRHNLNVIPYNTFEGSPFQPTDEDALQAFVKRLQESGCLVTVRRSRGRDVAAACGQLARPTDLRRKRGRAGTSPIASGLPSPDDD